MAGALVTLIVLLRKLDLLRWHERVTIWEPTTRPLPEYGPRSLCSSRGHRQRSLPARRSGCRRRRPPGRLGTGPSEQSLAAIADCRSLVLSLVRHGATGSVPEDALVAEGIASAGRCIMRSPQFGSKRRRLRWQDRQHCGDQIHRRDRRAVAHAAVASDVPPRRATRLAASVASASQGSPPRTSCRARRSRGPSDRVLSAARAGRFPGSTDRGCSPGRTLHWVGDY